MDPWVTRYTPSNTTKRHLQLARRLSNQSDFPRFKHGAVLVKGSAVINASFNKSGFNKFGAKFKSISKKEHASLHAELGAILNVERKRTEGSTIYVVRVNNHGELRMSKPCPMCEEALRFCGVKKVIYSVEDGYEMMKL